MVRVLIVGRHWILLLLIGMRSLSGGLWQKSNRGGTPDPLGVHPTSISYVYKVFQHLDMLWMGVWVHPFTGVPVQVGVEDFVNWAIAEPK
jgi:hypothetical protein